MSGDETNALRRPPPSRRYLIIVETSKPMQKRLDHIVGLVNALVSTRFKGQLNQGDTIGLWTYNETLSAGRFPLQKWAPENAKAIAAGLATFLRGEKYEKTANFNSVVPAMNRLAQNSDNITFILISSGQESISGTLYDEKINTSFSRWKDEEQKSKMPMLTILRALKGEFLGCNVGPAQWDIEFPPFPKETVVVAAPPAVITNSRPPVAASPLIVHGSRPASAPAINSMPIRETIQSPASNGVATASVKPAEPNQAAVGEFEKRAAGISRAVPQSAEPAVIPSTATETSPATIVFSNPSGIEPQKTNAKPANLPVPKFGLDALAVPPLPSPDNLTSTATQQTRTTPQAAGAAVATNWTTKTVTESTSVAKISPLTTPVAARELKPEPQTQKTPVPAQPPQGTVAKAAPSPVKTAQAAAAPNPFAQRTLWFSGGAIFALLVIGFIAIARRSVSHERVSLITSSFERRQK